MYATAAMSAVSGTSSMRGPASVSRTRSDKGTFNFKRFLATRTDLPIANGRDADAFYLNWNFNHTLKQVFKGAATRSASLVARAAGCREYPKNMV